MLNQVGRTLLGAIFMFGFFSGWAAASSFKNYPNLADNTAASAHYEIKKLIDGPVEAVFVVKDSGNVIAKAGGYLWKINPQGELIDTFDVPNKMFSSGIVFAEDYYIDWVFSGDKTKKKYAEQIDGNAFSEGELTAQLNRAEQLEFSRSDKNGKQARAYLHAGNRAWVLDISKHFDRVDDYCRGSERIYEALYWGQTCLKGYTKNTERLVYLQSGLSHVVTPVGFDRKYYYLREGVGGLLLELTIGQLIKPGNVTAPYWFGTGYFQLKHQLEVINFNAFADNDRQRINLDNLALFDPAAIQASDLKIITSSYRSYPDMGSERKLTPHYEKELGLYVVRKKIPTPTPQIHTPWSPSFSGKKLSVRAVSGNIAFLNGNGRPYHYWMDNRSTRPSAYDIPRKETQGVTKPLYELPKSLSLEWEMFSNSPLYKLKFAGRDVAVLGRDEEDRVSVLLDIQFDPVEIAAAFKRFDNSKLPLQLDIHVEEKGNAEADISIALKNKKDSVPLKNIQFLFDGKAVDLQNNKEGISLKEIQSLLGDKNTNLKAADDTLRAAYEAARSNKSDINLFFEMAKHKAEDQGHVQKHASMLTFYYTELLNTYNMNHDFKTSEVVVMHFMNDIFPHTGKGPNDPGMAYNITVIASQSLAFAAPTKNQAIVQLVLEKLLGPNFDPSAQTNGTLLYNLACYHAIQHNKTSLLITVKYARKLGKSVEQFMYDTDFKDYWQDAEFLSALKTS